MSIVKIIVNSSKIHYDDIKAASAQFKNLTHKNPAIYIKFTYFIMRVSR